MNSTNKTTTKLIKIEHPSATISSKTLEIAAAPRPGKNFRQDPVARRNCNPLAPPTPTISLSSLS